MNPTERARAKLARLKAKAAEQRALVRRAKLRWVRSGGELARLEAAIRSFHVPTCGKPTYAPIGMGVSAYYGLTCCGRDVGHRGKCGPCEPKKGKKKEKVT